MENIQVTEKIESTIKETPAFVQTLIDKFVSKKLIVMAMGTVLLVTGHLSGEQWLMLAGGYIGMEGAADVASRWKNPPNA